MVTFIKIEFYIDPFQLSPSCKYETALFEFLGGGCNEAVEANRHNNILGRLLCRTTADYVVDVILRCLTQLETIKYYICSFSPK